MNQNQEYDYDEQVSWADPNNTSLPVQEMHQDASNVNGHMSGTGVAVGNNDSDEAFLSQPYSTLDEPISETIMRDVRSVVSKIKVVLLPLQKTVSLVLVRLVLCLLSLFF